MGLKKSYIDIGIRYLSLCVARRTRDSLRGSVIAGSRLFRCVRSKVGFSQSKVKHCQVLREALLELFRAFQVDTC